MSPGETEPSTYYRLGALTAVVVLLLDQLSKWYASAILATGGIAVLPDFFDFDLVHNKGAAFGLFAELSPLWRASLLNGVAGVASIFLLFLLYRSRRRWDTFGLGLVLGGALGNLIDRVRMGSVVDFIHLHWYDLSWPVFNLADGAISLGVGFLLWDSWRQP